MGRISFAHCLVGAAAAVVLLAFGVQPETLVFLVAALACPLAMVLMMRGMMHGHGHGGAGDGAGTAGHGRTA